MKNDKTKPYENLSKDELFKKMEESSQNVIEALLKAAEHIPENLPEDQKEEFRRVLAMAESLKEKVDKVVKSEGEDHAGSEKKGGKSGKNK